MRLADANVAVADGIGQVYVVAKTSNSKKTNKNQEL